MAIEHPLWPRMASLAPFPPAPLPSQLSPWEDQHGQTRVTPEYSCLSQNLDHSPHPRSRVLGYPSLLTFQCNNATCCVHRPATGAIIFGPWMRSELMPLPT